MTAAFSSCIIFYINYKEYTNKNKEIQNKLLLFLDKQDNNVENYQNNYKLITVYKITDNRHGLRSFFNLISNFSNNHYQTLSFGNKISRFLEYLKKSIKTNFANQKLFVI